MFRLLLSRALYEFVRALNGWVHALSQGPIYVGRLPSASMLLRHSHFLRKILPPSCAFEDLNMGPPILIQTDVDVTQLFFFFQKLQLMGDM